MKCARASVFSSGLRQMLSGGWEKTRSPWSKSALKWDLSRNSITASISPNVLSFSLQRESLKAKLTQGSRSHLWLLENSSESLITAFTSYIQEHQENWVTPWNGPSHHLKYHLHQKQKEVCVVQIYFSSFLHEISSWVPKTTKMSCVSVLHTSETSASVFLNLLLIFAFSPLDWEQGR